MAQNEIFLGTPTAERMAELAKEIASEFDAMSPEQRAEHLTRRTFDNQKRDEKLFEGKSPEERRHLLEMREDLHDRMREHSDPATKPIVVASPTRSTSPLPWLDPVPDGLLGAEAALKAKRDKSYRRSKPRSDGW